MEVEGRERKPPWSSRGGGQPGCQRGFSGLGSGSSTSRASCPHRRLGAAGGLLLVPEGGI